MSDVPTSRNPWAAAALSLLSTGLGHIYSGRIVRGLALFCASLLFAPSVFALAHLPPATPVLVVLIVVVISMPGLYLFAVLDSWRAARAAGGSFVPRDYNHPVVYVLLGLVGLIYPAAATAYLRGYVFEPFAIPSGSMDPTILNGDRVLVNKLTRAGSPPERGDVVIFRVPDRPGRNWIKRVIGLPGDRVAVREGDVFVNGKKLDRDRVPAAHLAAPTGRGEVYAENLAGRRYFVRLGGGDAKAADYPEKTVSEGAYFVLGDNRDDSLDSRGFGFVARGDIVGDAVYVYLPAGSWSRFGPLRP